MRGGEAGGGALWMIDRDGFGHSQEVVRSASGHMGLAAAGGGIKLQAAKTEKVCYSWSFCFVLQTFCFLNHYNAN